MSLHSSLKVDTAGAQQRTVLTRIERIKDLMQKGLWKEDQKVTSLPKTRIIKIKARKAKKEDAEGAEGAEGAAAPAEGAAPAAAKGGTPAPEAKPAKGKK